MGIVALIFAVVAFLSVARIMYFSARYKKLKAEYEFLMKGLTKINKERLMYQRRKNESECTELFWRLKYHGAIDSLLDIVFKR